MPDQLPLHGLPSGCIRNAPTPADQGCYGCNARNASPGVPAHGGAESPASPTDAGEPVPLVYTVREAAEVLRIGYSTMKEHLRSGEIPSFKLGSRRLVAGEDLADWVRQQVAAGERGAA